MSKLKLCEEGNHYVASLFWAKRRDRKSACRQCAMKYAKPLKSNPKIKSIENWKPLNEVKTSSVSNFKRKPIKHISDKQSKLLKEYRIVRDEYMKNHPYCEFPNCNSRDIQLHHKRSREYYLCDTSVFMSVCDKHHRWIHDNDAKSRELGYLLQSI